MKYLRTIDDIEFEVEYHVVTNKDNLTYVQIDSIKYNGIDFSGVIDEKFVEQIEYELDVQEQEAEWNAKEAEYDRLKEDGDI
jgi:hypothetical protein